MRHHLFLILKDFILSILLTAGFLSILILISYFLLNQNFILSSQDVAVNLSKSSITQDIREINSTLTQVETIQNRNIDWTQIILDINSLIPHSEIQLGNFNISSQKDAYSLAIQGQALNRDAFLEFKNNLENFELIERVDSPLSNILYAENINFELNILFKDLYSQE